MSDGAAQPAKARLRRALAGTAEYPRPLADLALPSELDEFVSPYALEKLRSAAVLVPVINHPAGLSVMLTRRADSLRQHGGQISFPGGSRDPDDANAAAAALREAHEEIGLEPAQVELIGYLDDYPTGTGFRITPVVGCVEPPFVARLAADEVAEVFDVPLSVLLDPSYYARKTFERKGIRLPFYEVQYGDYRIWGATAGILWNLCERVRQYG